MINKLFLLLTLVSLYSCKQNNNSNVIVGFIESVNSEFSVTIDSLDEVNKKYEIASKKLVDNKFEFKLPKSKELKKYRISIINDSLKRKIEIIPIWFQNEDVKIQASLNDPNTEFEHLSVVGGKLNNIQNEFSNIVKTDFDKMQEELLINEGKEDSIFTKYTKLIEAKEIDLIYKKPNNLVSLQTIVLLSGGISKDSLELYYSLLDENLKQSKNGKLLFEHKKLKKLHIGDYIEDFVAYDLNNNLVESNKYKGKIILLDFWASWCEPCHKQNQVEFSKLYEKYKKDDFVIISYSLDEEKEKDDWKAASIKDNISWVNISNLKGFEDPLSKQYNINAIPQSFLVNRDGRIIKSFLGYNPEEDLIENEIIKLLE